MSIRSWLKNVKSACHVGRLDRRPGPRVRLSVEPLEDRMLLSTFTVVNTLDTPAHSSYVPPGSLRDAINRVNADTQPGIDKAQFLVQTEASF